MKKLAIFIALLFFSLCISAQKISIDKFLLFIRAKEGKVEKKLRELKFDFVRRYVDSTSPYVHAYWEYKSDSLKYNINLTINSNSNLVDEIVYSFNNKIEYLTFLSLLPEHGFKKKGQTHIALTEVNEEFVKDTLHAIMTEYRPEFGTVRNLYEIRLCFCWIVN